MPQSKRPVTEPPILDRLTRDYGVRGTRAAQRLKTVGTLIALHLSAPHRVTDLTERTIPGQQGPGSGGGGSVANWRIR